MNALNEKSLIGLKKKFFSFCESFLPVFIVLMFPLFIHSQQMLFWADEETGIWKSDLNGFGQQLLIPDEGATGLAIDVAGGKIYWTDNDDAENDGVIKRANLDGTGIEELIDEDVELHDLALDLVHGKIYWTTDDNEIKRANLNGSGEEVLLEDVDGVNGPEGIDVDPVGGKIYWAEEDDDEIRVANLNGSGDDVVIGGLDQPKAVALDLKNQKIYWTEEGSGEIWRADLDGDNAEMLVSGIDESNGLVLDVKRGKMYWTENDESEVPGEIWKANLNGTNPQLIVGPDEGEFEGIALDPTDYIPTLSQWGLIILGLSLTIVAVVCLNAQLSNSNSMIK